MSNLSIYLVEFVISTLTLVSFPESGECFKLRSSDPVFFGSLLTEDILEFFTLSSNGFLDLSRDTTLSIKLLLETRFSLSKSSDFFSLITTASF